jgi:hypothetical protein
VDRGCPIFTSSQGGAKSVRPMQLESSRTAQTRPIVLTFPSADGLPWGHPGCASRDFPSLRMQASGFRRSLFQQSKINSRAERDRLPKAARKASPAGLVNRRSSISSPAASPFQFFSFSLSASQSFSISVSTPPPRQPRLHRLTSNGISYPKLVPE